MPSEPDDGSEFSEALQTYDILSQQHRHDNRLIHTTFYVNVVLIAGLLTIVTGNSLSWRFQLLISILAICVFFALGLWTWLYAAERKEAKLKKDDIVADLPKGNHLREFHQKDTTPGRFVEYVKFYGLILGFYLVPATISIYWLCTILSQWG